MTYNSVDLYAGCGGLTRGMERAGFDTKVAVEIEDDAVLTFKMNHKKTDVIQKDIRLITAHEVKTKLSGQQLHLLAGCPPCQGFSSVRRLNRKRNIRDKRNNLVLEYLRFVKELKPLTIMMENVPGLIHYYLFKQMLRELKVLGYFLDTKIVDAKDFGVPQRRKRLVLVGSLLGEIKVAEGTGPKVTVRDAIWDIEDISLTRDPIHRVVTKHQDRIQELIAMIPKDGGSRKDLNEQYTLKCHKKKNVGFNDIYGRLRWDDYSSTITGGCLNPSKGRFLHPVKNRAINAREAALLQSFPRDYKFPNTISKTSIALLIGNALPPKLSYAQSLNIKNHLEQYLG